MAGIKISALPSIPSSQTTDAAPFVQGAVTYKATNAQLITLYNGAITLSSIAQVTGLPAALASFLPLAGGTMTGDLDMGTHYIQNLADPINPQDGCTKAYADLAGGGFTVILACRLGTTADLNATQAGAGIGATLTNAGAMVALTIDGVATVVNDRILVKDQTLPAENGIYTVTDIGSGATNWILTRATDYDTAAEIQPGTLVAVNAGTVNASTSWLETATVVTVDTDPVLFSQFTFAPSSFFQIANNLSEGVPATMRTNLGLTAAAIMTLPVSGTNGGTGVNNGASTITIGGNVTFSGAFTTAFTITGNTAVTLPTTGTIITSSQPTINQPNIVGTTTNDSAAAGSVGELISSVVAVASAVTCTSGVVRDVTSILLSAGDWDVFGNIIFPMTGGNATVLVWWSNSTSATTIDASLVSGFTGTAGNGTGGPIPTRRYSLAVPTTVYLSVVTTHGGGVTVKACGGIYARRVR